MSLFLPWIDLPTLIAIILIAGGIGAGLAYIAARMGAFDPPDSNEFWERLERLEQEASDQKIVDEWEAKFAEAERLYPIYRWDEQ